MYYLLRMPIGVYVSGRKFTIKNDYNNLEPPLHFCHRPITRGRPAIVFSTEKPELVVYPILLAVQQNTDTAIIKCIRHVIYL